ncbi:hypothetical protein, partial [Rhodococcus erythropolis]|uniref:hypothetical protein n=1 Tax=Rhodococcus erythropolis TaxID=1833 RepID=UPI0022B5048C
VSDLGKGEQGKDFDCGAGGVIGGRVISVAGFFGSGLGPCATPAISNAVRTIFAVTSGDVIKSGMIRTST